MRARTAPDKRGAADRVNDADPQVLGQLLAAVGILPALTTTHKTAEFALEVLRTVYRGAACAVCVRGVGRTLGDLPHAECAACSQPPGFDAASRLPCALAARGDLRAYGLRTLDGDYGYLLVGASPAEQKAFSAYEPFVMNFANSVATSLENRWQKEQLEERNLRLLEFGRELQTMVTERTKELAATNARLARESHRNKAFLRNASDGVHILDADGNVLEVSDSFCEMLGYSREELLGANVELWDAQWSPRELKQVVAEQLVRGARSVFETRHRRKDGRILDVEVTGHALELEGGTAVFNSARDITERKKARDALSESERRYHDLFDQANEGLMVMTCDGKLLDVNKAFAGMHGYTVDDLRQMDITALDVLRQRTMEDRTDIARRIQAGETVRFEVEHVHQDGHIFPLNVTASSIEIDGQLCYLAFHQDITERKRLEQAHLRAQKLESLGTLAGGVAHDFNNILAAIQGNADLAALDLGQDHAAAESLGEIRKASVRASELVRRIMAFGRPKEVQKTAVDLGAVAGEVLKLLRSTLPAGISLTRNFDPETPDVLADAGQIHEAIVNLTTNAAHAIGPRAGGIEYRLEAVQVDEELAAGIPGLEPGRYARLTVTDNGCGMDAATRERIFDAFYTTKPVGEGTGLGLSMVHGIMKGHGGAVTVESAPGKGASFALYFPAAGAGAVKEKHDAPAQSLPAAGRKVLYVDDEEALVFLASRVLTRLGHSISGFTDPEAALAAFRTQPQDFDVVVTDLSMPHMSGFELARAVLALHPGMPVLMTTGYVRAGDEDRARAAGIRELILKPVTTDELGRVIDRLFRNSKAAE